MNVLPHDNQVQVISALTEGLSIRGAERLTGIHRDTVMRLGARVGQGCAMLHDQMMQNLQVARIEMDELWSYIGKKQKRTAPGDDQEKGDCYTYIAMDATGKAILSYFTGKREATSTQAFVADLRARVINKPELSSDAFNQYRVAVEMAFGADVTYGQVEKHYSAPHSVEAARRYSPGDVVTIKKHRIAGNPERISTSFIERQNLTLRMQSQRFRRLTIAYSKRLENHKAAVALYVAHYNLCRVHETTRITPAMALGITDHVWSIGELMAAALSLAGNETEGRRYARVS